MLADVLVPACVGRAEICGLAAERAKHPLQGHGGGRGQVNSLLSLIWQTMLEGLGRAGVLAEHLWPDHSSETKEPKPRQSH